MGRASQLAIVKNATTGLMQEEHILAIPPCCPVSKNPREGSTLTIRYCPHGCSLEIASLFAYIHSFKDGLYTECGHLVVRDMEGMLQRIFEECETLLGVPVQVEAHLRLAPFQEMHVTIERDVQCSPREKRQHS